MQPTPEQLTAINSQLQFQRRDLMRERNLSLIEETITEWESIRQPDDRQLVRTNHELAQQLAGVQKELAAKQETVDEAIRQLNRAQGLYRAIIEPIEPFFPDGSRDLEFDVLPFTIYGLAKKAADYDQASKPAPAPLAFPDPPQGWEWYNPKELTPGVVGIKDGWRLRLMGEIIAVGDEFFDLGGFWQTTSYDGMPLYPAYCAYRTKAPLPAPKPTAEELERAEFEKWAFPLLGLRRLHQPDAKYYCERTEAAWTAWKAARASKEGQQ